MLLLQNFQGQCKCYRGGDAIIRKHRDMFFEVSRSSGGIHRHLDLPHASRFQAIRTNHRGCAASTGLDPVDHKSFFAHAAKFKYMLGLLPLDNRAEMILELIDQDLGPLVFLGRSDRSDTRKRDERHGCQNKSLHNTSFPNHLHSPMNFTTTTLSAIVIPKVLYVANHNPGNAIQGAS